MRITSPVMEGLKAFSPKSAWPYRLIYRFPALFRPLITGFAKKRAGSSAALFHTTCALTQLSGSGAVNVLPVTAAAGLDLRLLPGDSLEQAVSHVRRAVNDPRVKVELTAGNDPSPVSETSGPAFERIRQAAQAAWPGALTLPALMTGASDAYHYSAVCPRVYRFSPLKISPELNACVHAANERLPVKALEEAVLFYKALIKSMNH